MSVGFHGTRSRNADLVTSATVSTAGESGSSVCSQTGGPMSFRMHLCQCPSPSTELLVHHESVSLVKRKRQSSVWMFCFPVIKCGPPGVSGHRGGIARIPREASKCLAGFSAWRIIPRVTDPRNRRTCPHLHTPSLLESSYSMHRVSLHEFKGRVHFSLLLPSSLVELKTHKP